VLPDDGRAAAHGRVAVLIPVYNDDGRLAATLASLRQQGVPFTAVVVDDGSAPPVCVDEGAYDFPVALLRQPRNGGIERALNAGLEFLAAAGFEYVARLDNGDLCAPARLARQQAFLDEHPDVALVGSNVEWRRGDGSLAFSLALPETHEAISRAFHHTVCLIHPAVMFRLDAVRAVGPYSLDYPAAEDYELFWRIARRFRVANIPETLLTTRFDPGGISVTRRARQLRSRLRIQLAFFRAGEPMSYVGLAKTLALMSVPYRLIVPIKRLRSAAALGRRAGPTRPPHADHAHAKTS
jgi:glycosyltransferase involved in cell wall biosynthesis